MLKENGFGGNLDNVAKVIWGYVETMKASQKGRTVYSEPSREMELFRLTVEKIPSTKGNMRVLDLSEFFMNSTDCSSYQDFKKRLRDFVHLKNFEFYFQLGTARGFDEGYCLGTGRMLSFNSLPDDVKDYISRVFKVGEPRREVSGDWFMNINVRSLGQHKSLETAIQRLRRNVSIFRLSHLVLDDDFYAITNLISPYKYVGKTGSQFLACGYDPGRTWFYLKLQMSIKYKEFMI